MAKVACMEPSVLIEYAAGALVVLVVAQHHVRPLGYEFAFSGSRVDIVQPHADAVGGLARAAEHRMPRLCAADQRSCLGQPVARHIREMGFLQEVLHLRVELGTAYSEELHPASEGLHQLHSHEPVQQSREMLLQEGEEFALCNGLDHAAAVHLLYDERHGEHYLRPDLAHCVYEYGRGRKFLDIPHACAACKRVEHTYAHFVGMGHRQYGKEGHTLVDMEIVPGFQDVPAEIAVGEHHALGVAGGSGSIEYGSNVHRVRGLDIAVAGICLAVHLYETEIVQADDQFEFRHPFRADFGLLLDADENHFGLGMLQDVLHLGRGELGKHRDKNASESSSCKECNGPVGHTLGEYCHLVSGIDSETGELA